MSAAAHAPYSADDADHPGGWEKALLDHQLAELSRLAAMGMDLATAVHGQAMADAAAAATPAQLQHAAIDFARVSRAVRLTFALQSKLIADFKAPVRPAKASAASDTDDPESMELEVFWLGGREVNEPIRRADVKRSVARAAESEGLDREAVDRLVREAGERLERDDYGDIMHRRLNAIIVEIHRDLGLPDPRATWDPKRFGYWDRDGNRLPDPTAADSS